MYVAPQFRVTSALTIEVAIVVTPSAKYCELFAVEGWKSHQAVWNGEQPVRPEDLGQNPHACFERLSDPRYRQQLFRDLL
jgi:hypothetical protein